MIVTHSYDETVIFFFFERYFITVSAYEESREAKRQTISKDVTLHHFATERGRIRILRQNLKDKGKNSEFNKFSLLTIT